MILDADLTAPRPQPLAAALGEIYTGKLAGTLDVFDGRSRSPAFRFWFKRGFPYFSKARDGMGRLGELLAGTKRLLVEQVVRAAEAQTAESRPLLGQLLLRQSIVTHDDLQLALLAQLQARLLLAASLPDGFLAFREGMGELGRVPLSSPLLNPLETAARAVQLARFDVIREYLAAALRDAAGIRLAADRKVPPLALQHLSATLCAALCEPTRVERILEAPAQARSLCFLLSFGFTVVASAPQEQPRPETAAVPDEAMPCLADGQEPTVARLLRVLHEGGSWYELLGLPLSCARADVKQRYRELAFEIHPDRVPPGFASSCQAVFARLVDAYQTLTKERLRCEYDARLVWSGRWRRLGTPADVSSWLSQRFQAMTAAGLHDIAQEYFRLHASLRGTIPVPSGSELRA